MSEPIKDLLDHLAQIKPRPKAVSERIYPICAALLYPIWGLVSSALVLNAYFLHSPILRSVVAVPFAGLLPIALHLYEVRAGKTYFEWQTVFISISLGGILALFLGSMLQGLLLLCRVHSILGLRIDTWYWHFPSWMFRADY